VKAGDGVDAADVPECHRGIAEFRRAIGEVFGIGSRFEEREGAPAAKFDIVRWPGGHAGISLFFRFLANESMRNGTKFP
jgi:hypothetical protein